MTRTVRLAAVPVPLALSLSAVLLLSACGGSPVQAGAAATIGDERIDTRVLRSVVDRGLSDEQAAEQLGTDRPAFQRQVLSRLITGRLLRAAAAERDVEVTEGDVDARLAEFATQLGGREQLLTQAAQSGIAEPDLRPFIRDLTLNDELADDLVGDQQVPAAALRTLYQQNIAQFDQVVARHILLPTGPEAQQVLATVRRDPAQFASIAAARSLDEGSKARGGELDPAGRGAYVAEFEAALFGAEEGEYGVVQTQFGFHVYNLLERRTTTLAEATPQLRRQALAEPREQAIAELLRETARAQEVRVNPRFGQWDPETVSVVEAGTEGPDVVSSPDQGDGPAVDPLAPGGAPPQEAPQGEAPPQEVPEGAVEGEVPQEAPQEVPQQAPEQAPATPTQ